MGGREIAMTNNPLNELKAGLADLTERVSELDEWTDGDDAPVDVKSIMENYGNDIAEIMVQLKYAELFAKYFGVSEESARSFSSRK